MLPAIRCLFSNRLCVQFGAAFASSLLVALASPPFDLWPLAGCCLLPLLWAMREAAPLRAAALGWFFGLALFGTSCWWWPGLLTRFAALGLLPALLIALALAAYQALTYGLWAGATSLLSGPQTRYRLHWYLTAPMFMVVCEWSLPFFFKGYLAIVAWRFGPLAQAAEIGGPPLVSALVVLINLLLAGLLHALCQRQWPGRPLNTVNVRGSAVFLTVGGGPVEPPAAQCRALRHAQCERMSLLKSTALGRPFLAATLVAALALVGGELRMQYIAGQRSQASKLTVGLVQPNFGIVSSEERKLNSQPYVEALRQASIELEDRGAGLVIWPESAWPLLFDRDQGREYPAGHPWQLRGKAKGRLLFGTLSHSFGSNEVYNSAVLINGNGAVSGLYDKADLIPFAEFIPLADRFPAWAARVKARTPLWPTITHGTGPTLLIDGNLRIAPLICSDDLDPAFVQGYAKERPNLLVSLVSDAWFGDSAAPWQHLALSTFRAIELRRDLVRVTNTGVSAIVDATGKAQMTSDLVSPAPAKPQPPTLFMGEVALLDNNSPLPMLRRGFPFLCLLLLTAAFGRCLYNPKP